jgi:predicted nucleic acid-binding Zn finger protein
MNVLQIDENKVDCNLNDYTVLKELEKSILEQFKFTYEKEKCISDDMLESMHFIYKEPLLEALNQIDKFEEQLQLDNKKATRLFDPNVTHTIQEANSAHSKSLVTTIKGDTSGRYVYQVKGSKGVNYYLFENFNFCSCSSFKHNVLNKFDFIYCKHIIMIKLLKAMDKVPSRSVKELELVDVIKQIQ